MKFRVERKDALWCAGLLLTAAAIFSLWPLIVMPLARSLPVWLFEAVAIVLQVCTLVAVGAGIGALIKRKTMGMTIAFVGILLVAMLIKLPGR